MHLTCCIRIVERRIHQGRESAEGARYHRVARTTMLFVGVFVLQYWTAAVFNAWQSGGKPPLAIIWCAVFFPNQGGLLNAFAYTILRRRQRAVEAGTQAVNTPATNKF